MKKSPWIVFCVAVLLAGVSGQTTAFGQTTNAAYSITADFVFKCPRLKVDKPVNFLGTGTFLNGVTCILQVGTNDFTGTYVVAKNGKSAKLTLDTGGTSTKNFVAGLIASDPDIPTGVTVTVKSVRFSHVKLSGDSLTVASAVSGTLSATIDGKNRSTGFSLKGVWTGTASGTPL
jgi:hypothetical protein